MADFIQAVKWMKEGKKVRTKIMVKNVYVYISCNRLFHKGCNSDSPLDSVWAFEATDWEIYKEKDDWKLSDEVDKECAVCGKEGNPCGVIFVSSVKTFIQKVKEDINQIDITISASGFYQEVMKRLDKRAGDLK